MDVAQNSITAGACLITISVEEKTEEKLLIIRVEDDGCGMSAEQLKMVQDPFYTTRTTRKVGLGIPLFKMAAEMTGGSFSIESEQGRGTKLKALFNTGHIDMIPAGAMDETVLLLITANPELDFIYRFSSDGRGFTLDTRELREILGNEVPLSSPEVVLWLREYLEEKTAGTVHRE